MALTLNLVIFFIFANNIFLQCVNVIYVSNIMQKNISWLSGLFEKYLAIFVAVQMVGITFLFYTSGNFSSSNKILFSLSLLIAGFSIFMGLRLKRVRVDIARNKIFIKGFFKIDSTDLTNIKKITITGGRLYNTVYRVDFIKPTAFGKKIYFCVNHTPEKLKTIEEMTSIVNRDNTLSGS